jgi:diketogulonate reductase-like aldo/keto reductase
MMGVPDIELPLSRRAFVVTGGAALMVGPAAAASVVRAADDGMRAMPGDGRLIPAVGMGTWQTFNVGADPVARDARAEVMRAFFAEGGRMIDSSPMYGSAQAVIGHGLEKLGAPDGFLPTDKIWTSDRDGGRAQLEESRALWGVPRFEVMQVHNLRAWEAHLALLTAMRDERAVRYIGITTSHGRRHDLMEQVMRGHAIDVAQFTYNPIDREAEARLLPTARDRGIAVIVNRPFRRGALTRRLEGAPLPGWAAEIGAATWAQAILKFILSHPAVTVVIPATTRPEHARENMIAARGELPDDALRERIACDIRALV